MAELSREALWRALPEPSVPIVHALAERVAARGGRLWLVGGPVRDWLLGEPLRDVDLLAEHVPSATELLAEVAPADASFAPHERFASATLALLGARIDLGTPRREHYPRPGALPRVEPGDLASDLARRDFAVNAMAVMLATPEDGAQGPLEVLDPHRGRADLAARRLRLLHDRGFHDDPTRAMRAARLVSRLGLTLARSARARLRDALRDGAFGAVSGERLRREFELVFHEVEVGGEPVAALRRLREWHVLSALEPGLDLPAEALAPLRRLGRALVDPPWSGPAPRALYAGLAVWLAPLPPALRRRALGRLSVRGDAAERVLAYASERRRWLADLSRARGRGAVDAVLGSLDEERLLALWADAPVAARRRIVRWAAVDRPRRIPVSGRDLTSIGLEGEAVGRALHRIRAAFLDGALANREEALALAREMLRASRARAGRTRSGQSRARAGRTRSGQSRARH